MSPETLQLLSREFRHGLETLSSLKRLGTSKRYLVYLSFVKRFGFELSSHDVPLSYNFKWLTEVNQIINGDSIFFFSKENVLYNLFGVADDELKNSKKFYARNEFTMESMMVIGGGALPQLNRCLGYGRVGGSTQDKINYLRCYLDKSTVTDLGVRTNFSKLYSDLGLKQKLVLSSAKRVVSHYKMNFCASSGGVRAKLNQSKKGESIVSDLMTFKLNYLNWVSSVGSGFQLNEIWYSASRPKLINFREKIVKIRNGNPCSRVISMPSSTEALVGYPIYLQVSEFFLRYFKRNFKGISIGVNRISSEWARMSTHFEGSRFIYVGDYSKYDQSIPLTLMRGAFDFILGMFDENEIYTKRYIINFREWLEKNMYHRYQVVDDKVVFELKNGVPSGTLWTSLLDSVINLLIIEGFKQAYGLEAVDYFIYGDDHVIIVREEICPEWFRCTYESYVQDNFGMTLGGDDSYISTPSEYFVNYSRPIYVPGEYLLGGTSKLRAQKYEESSEPFGAPDPLKKGTTHRWNYNFKRRVKFLQYYWTKEGMSLRPWPETLKRIINPEEKIRDVGELEVLYISHLIDNYNNAHVRNWIYHLLYDMNFVKRKVEKLGPAGFKKHSFFRDRAALARMRSQPIVSEGGVVSRGWYRKLDEYTNLFEDRRMAGFNRYFKGITAFIDNIMASEDDVNLMKKRNIIGAISARRHGYMEKLLEGKGNWRPKKIPIPESIGRHSIHYRDEAEKDWLEEAYSVLSYCGDNIVSMLIVLGISSKGADDQLRIYEELLHHRQRESRIISYYGFVKLMRSLDLSDFRSTLQALLARLRTTRFHLFKSGLPDLKGWRASLPA